MGRTAARSFSGVLVAIALALWGVPFGALARADEPSLAVQAAPMEAGSVWDGSADTSWYSSKTAEFTIRTPEQLAGLAAIVNGEASGIARDDFTGKTVTLGSDIMLNPYAAGSKDEKSSQRNWTPIGRIVETGVDRSKGWNAPSYDNTRCFNGTFDGAGHVVKNIFRYTVSDEEYGGFSGLFGALGERAVVTRVGIDGGFLYGRVVGGIAAASRVSAADMPEGGPLIDGCFNSATIEGHGSSTRAAGGIFGGHEFYDSSVGAYQAMARIENCSNEGAVAGMEAQGPAGGIAGYGSVRISGCLNTGAVSGTNAGATGLIAGAVLAAGYQNASHPTGVGANYGGFVRNCNASANSTLYHAFETSGDEGKASATAVSKDEANGVFLLDGYPWFSEPSGGDYSVGAAFGVANIGGVRCLRLRWQEGIATTEITNGCIVGGVAKTYQVGASMPKPVVRIAGSSGVVELVKGTDYDLSFVDSQGKAVTSLSAAGTYTAVVQGAGGYSGMASRTFKVEEKAAPAPVPAKKTSLSTASVAMKDQVYTGRALTPAPTVKVGKTKLKKNTDYTVSYSANKNVGIATVTVKAKSESTKYTGSKKATFKIAPKPTALTKLSKGKKQVTAMWKKQTAQVTGYQLLLATNSKFTAGKKTITIKSFKTVKTVAKGLKAKKKYWAKVRTYKKVGSKTYYSAWSNVKSATTS